MPLLQTLTRAAFYDGSLFHSIINYALIAGAVQLHRLPPLRLTCGWHAWVPLAILIAALQVIVWFSADAVGVSLIWSALYGHAVAALAGQRRRGFGLLRQSAYAVVLLAMGAGGYLFYAITFPPITTIAHSVAAAIGASWYALFAGLSWWLGRRTAP